MQFETCCKALPDGQRKKDCTQLLPSTKGENLCRANIQTYCTGGDAGALDGQASWNDSGSSEDCVKLRGQCEACSDPSGRSSCDSIVSQGNADSCAVVLQAGTFARGSDACPDAE